MANPFNPENDDMVAAARQRAAMAKLSREKGDEDALGQVGGIIGGAIGAYFGGPQGAMMGYQAGSNVGGGVANLSQGDTDEGLKQIMGGVQQAQSIEGDTPKALAAQDDAAAHPSKVLKTPEQSAAQATYSDEELLEILLGGN